MFKILNLWLRSIWGVGLYVLENPATGEPTTPIRPKLPTKSGTTKSTIGNNPGLITSTGGLSGNSEMLVTPYINTTTGNCHVTTYNSTDFDCEDDAEYDFRQEANYGQIPGEGRECTIHMIILKYRENGYAKFNLNITVFKQAIDDYQTVTIPVQIPPKPLTKARLAKFPDGNIHTLKLYPPNGVVQGERPQITITRKGKSGPMSITKLIICGNADETAQQ